LEIRVRAKWLIVGAGFTGCTLAERIATQLDDRVLLVDRRPHVGGNAFDSEDEHGILVHRYGPHIFHTNSRKVWGYLSNFTNWRPYEHKVLGMIDGRYIPLPFNLNSLRATCSAPVARRLGDKLVTLYGAGGKVPILKLLENPDEEINHLAKHIYDKVFYNYTVKQWDLTPEQLDHSVTARVPIRLNYDDRYFDDIYQAMPSPSYNEMFSRMLDHPNIEVSVDTDFRDIPSTEFMRTIFTGPIDEYFGYAFGELPYRSLRFEFENIDQLYYQPVATVNYPNAEVFTRITEQKYITGQAHARTTIVREYPQPHAPGKNDPYYPIPCEQNRSRYELYFKEANKMRNSVSFVGRLADYRYYNMDQAVARALKTFLELAA
jgi:UDP-galactopyranose mutase